jgi:hypothetical protein
MKSYIIESSTNKALEIGKLNMEASYKLLGVHIPFYGTMHEHLQYLHQRSIKLQISFNQLSISTEGVYLGVRTTIHRILNYSSAATTLDDHSLHTVTNKLYHRLLPKLGFNRHFPKVRITAPKKFGGIDLMDLADQQKYAHIDTIFRHFTQQTIISTFLIQLLESFQIKSDLFGSCFVNTANTSYVKAP